MNIFEKVFGTYSSREIKKVQHIAKKVINLEKEYENLTNEELKNKTQEFKDRLKTETLNDILPEAFATVREAAWRVLGLKPYEVQVLGGIILHQGRIAEMKTGEGKTLVATMPSYLNALTGNVLVVTANEYLAKRDSEQMGKIHNFLGLSVGFIDNDMDIEKRKIEYGKDILYTTNNEVGFDYLRDNMVLDKQNQVQREYNYVIIDEVDSILIDEARTPLIISGKGEDSSDGYIKADKFVQGLKGVVKDNKENEISKIEMRINNVDENDQYKDFDYIVDKKTKTTILTEKGIKKAEKEYSVENLMDIDNVEINHYISKALKAHYLFKRDIDYIVKDNEVIIIDEHTGRIMNGRRYSEGMHQAIEVKENVEVKSESKTLATISFQNLFRKFNKLSGMTGTAMTETTEFREIYNSDVVEIPTNKPLIREDKTDKVYLTREGKLEGIIETVKECNKKGQPILVGTASVEASEELSKLFNKVGIEHSVLNAKHHEQEAKIIAKAGHYGRVTIATNMAGRGTDIMLGGNVEFKVKEELKKLGYEDSLIELSNTHTEYNDEQVIEIRNKYNELQIKFEKEIEPWIEKVKNVGGLYVLGTERHSSRRIDNQLRGRAGRQGDPGVSEFTISLEDDLMMTFGADRFSDLFEKMDLPEDVPIDIKFISNSIEKAQKKIEGMHYNARKTLIEYDSVMNIQREIIYEQRNRFLEEDNMLDYLSEMIGIYIEENINYSIMKSSKITLDDQECIKQAFIEIPGLESLPNYTEDELLNIKTEDIINNIKKEVQDKINLLVNHTDEEYVNFNSKRTLLFFIDDAWQEHLVAMDDLIEGIGLRAYAQQDPVIAYKNEGYNMFQEMLNYVRKQIFIIIMKNYQIIINKIDIK